jgi:hypothetical protein
MASGPVDIIGDVHGEIDALRRLLSRLGCQPERGIAQRPLIFVGDLVDRGPDSPAVVELVMQLVREGIAQVVMGNHEFNLLRGDKKEGNGWALGDADDHYPSLREGKKIHVAFGSRVPSGEQLHAFMEFFSQLPLALQRSDLRVAHAAWSAEALSLLPESGNVLELSKSRQTEVERELKLDGTLALEQEELNRWAQLRARELKPTEWLEAHALAEERRQLADPVRVITSGPEVRVPKGEHFFVGGRWRYVARDRWWEKYNDAAAVVVGHYWRARGETPVDGKTDMWQSTSATEWKGPRNNVFCVDFSVGRRFLERWEGRDAGSAHGLAALRWPERELVFDDGWVMDSTGAGHSG